MVDGLCHPQGGLQRLVTLMQDFIDVSEGSLTRQEDKCVSLWKSFDTVTTAVLNFYKIEQAYSIIFKTFS